MNPWKILAIIMIGLLIIVTGFKFAFMEAHSFQLSEEQKNFAIAKAKDGLKAELGDKYNVTVPERGRIISSPDGNKKVVRVILNRGNVTFSALVDMETGDLVEMSRIEKLGWMTEYRMRDPGRWGHLKLFNR